MKRNSGFPLPEEGLGNTDGFVDLGGILAMRDKINLEVRWNAGVPFLVEGVCLREVYKGYFPELVGHEQVRYRIFGLVENPDVDLYKGSEKMQTVVIPATKYAQWGNRDKDIALVDGPFFFRVFGDREDELTVFRYTFGYSEIVMRVDELLKENPLGSDFDKLLFDAIGIFSPKE
ncbi:MAG: hypothetical protein Q7K40_01540 [bacterium]|nr:hypothetical protein [bacterium]